MNLKYL